MTVATRLETKRVGLSASLYEPMNSSDIRRIADAAFDVLAESGMLVYSPVALEAFESAGAETDMESRVVKLPRGLVEDAIASNPSSSQVT